MHCNTAKHWNGRNTRRVPNCKGRNGDDLLKLSDTQHYIETKQKLSDGQKTHINTSHVHQHASEKDRRKQ